MPPAELRSDRPAGRPRPLPRVRSGGRSACRVRPRLPGRPHPVVRRTRAAGGAGLPDARADLAARRPHHGDGRPAPELSPRGVAHLVLSLPRALDLTDVILVGSDTGGAICQLVLDEDASRVGRLVLTNCDAFDSFPPFPFDLLFRLGTAPGADPGAAAADAARRAAQQRLGFGWLVRRKLTADESRPVGDAVPHRCGRTPRRRPPSRRGWRPEDLVEVATPARRVRPAGPAVLGAGRPVLQARPRPAAGGRVPRRPPGRVPRRADLRLARPARRGWPTRSALAGRSASA